MLLHANAKLGLAGRLALVRAVEDGCSLRQAAAAFSVSPATVHRWWHRWLEGGREASALLDRSSRPRRSPRELAPELQERICACRRETGWGPRLVAAATGFAHSTVWKVLKRAGISRHRSRSRPTATSGPAPATCCTWTCLAMRVSFVPAIASPATAHSAHAIGCVLRPGSATTRSSTTTPALPTSSSTQTRRQPR
jgi:transposase